MRYFRECAGIVLSIMLTVPVAAGAGDTNGTTGGIDPDKNSGAPATTLKETVEATLGSHRALKVIQENREVIVHELRRAEAGWGPRVDVNGQGGAGQLSNTTTRPLNGDKGFYGATGIGLTLTQPLWDGFATRSRVRTAEATLDSMTSRVLDNANTLGLDGIIAHIDVLRRREIYRLAEENVRRHREILASSRDREQLGADTMADVTQTEGRLARALSTLSEARASLLEGEDSYRRITGLPLPGSLEPVELPASMYDGAGPVMAEAVKRNPKLAAYLSDIRAAVGDKELAESAFHPIINLEAGPQYADRRGPGDDWTSSFDVMGTIRWNLFNSGADTAETRAALARIRQARQTMYNFYDDLKLEIENTWVAYQAAREQYKHYTDAIGYNIATRDAYLEQFMLGQRSLLDVLDAENELFNSSTQAETAKGNILVGGFRLYALAGVLLSTVGVSTDNLNKAPQEPLPDPAWAFSAAPGK